LIGTRMLKKSDEQPANFCNIHEALKVIAQ